MLLVSTSTPTYFCYIGIYVAITWQYLAFIYVLLNIVNAKHNN